MTDTPYPEITQASRALAERMYELSTDDSTLLESLEALWEAGSGMSGNQTIPLTYHPKTNP